MSHLVLSYRNLRNWKKAVLEKISIHEEQERATINLEKNCWTGKFNELNELISIGTLKVNNLCAINY